MTGSKAGWWFSADKKWHEGDPPRGWWQSPTGRWHPPGEELRVDEAEGLVDTAEIPGEELTAGAPRHMASSEQGLSTTEENELWDPVGGGSPGGQPIWLKLGVPVTLTALMVVVAAIGFLAWKPSMSVEDPTTGRPGSGEDGRQDNVRITSNSGEGSGADGSPPGSTDESSRDSSPGQEEDGSSGPSGGDGSPSSEASDETKSKAEFEPAETDSEEGGDPSTGSGSPDDCADWTPPGRPDHPTAPDRANREDCA